MKLENIAATSAHRLNVILADPSLFTGPYDSGLSAGLLAAGVDCKWVIRPLRDGERNDLPAGRSAPLFYRGTDRASWAPRQLRPLLKGFSHIIGWTRLLRQIDREKPDVLHLQWTVLPLIDAIGMLVARKKTALVLTVHDATPFNGDRLSILQRAGFDYPIKIAQRVIVHTQSAAQKLVSRGCGAEKIHVVPHGPLAVGGQMELPPLPRTDPRFTFVLFGQIKPYKGLDILTEALALLSPEQRRQMRVIVAGAPMMNMSPIERRIHELDLRETIDLRLGRLSDDQMARLFQEADSFVFPYRQIDASGVYYLVRPLKKWMIASKVGVFEEDFIQGADGDQVPPENPRALADALERALNGIPPDRPQAGGADWMTIGVKTRSIYADLLKARSVGASSLRTKPAKWRPPMGIF